jgi:hypothetical protein
MTIASMSSLSTALTLSKALRACPLIAVLRWIGPDELKAWHAIEHDRTDAVGATTCATPS